MYSLILHFHQKSGDQKYMLPLFATKIDIGPKLY